MTRLKESRSTPQKTGSRTSAARGDISSEATDERPVESALAHPTLGVISDLAGAEREHLAAVSLLRKLDCKVGLAHSLDNLGCVRQRLGQLDEAFANHTEAREIAVEIGDRACEAYALNNIGNTHRLAGRLDDAIAHQHQARRVADLVVDPNLRTQLYLDRGETAWAAHDERAALHAYRAALDLSADSGERVQRARTTYRVATVLHAIGQHAGQLAGRARRVHRAGPARGRRGPRRTIDPHMCLRDEAQMKTFLTFPGLTSLSIVKTLVTSLRHTVHARVVSR